MVQKPFHENGAQRYRQGTAKVPPSGTAKVTALGISDDEAPLPDEHRYPANVHRQPACASTLSRTPGCPREARRFLSPPAPAPLPRPAPPSRSPAPRRQRPSGGDLRPPLCLSASGAVRRRRACCAPSAGTRSLCSPPRLSRRGTRRTSRLLRARRRARAPSSAGARRAGSRRRAQGRLVRGRGRVRG